MAARDFQPVRAVTLHSEMKGYGMRASYRSPLRYPGGKSRAWATLSGVIPAHMGDYREPLAGGASIFFRVRSEARARSFWINDCFRELHAFWKVAQRPEGCDRLMEELSALRASWRDPREIKEYFLEARKRVPRLQYEMAKRFFLFNRITFSGTTRAGGFSAEASQRRFTPSSIERLRMMPEALRGVRITRWDYQRVIERPGHDVFLFLDPPYLTTSRLYGPRGNLHAFDHERLAWILRRTGHRFLITYDDCPPVRRLYPWAHVRRWRVQYGMSNCNRERQSKRGAELLVSNHPFHPAPVQQSLLAAE